MKFEMNHKVGTDYSTVTFHDIKVKWDVIAQMMSWFERLGGTLIETNVYQFPSFITVEIIQEVIHNTCFVCGGLMKDEEYHSDHILRKCCSCRHSHT